MLEPLCPGSHSVHFRTAVGPPSNPSYALEVTYHLTVEACLFRRGDANDDGKFDLADIVFTLDYLFGSGSPLACQDAADADDDGRLNLTDAVFSLNHLVRGGSSLPTPGSDSCGSDPTHDKFVDCGAACP